jgi:hypothetical protein
MKLVSIVVAIGTGGALGIFMHAHPDWTFWHLAMFLVAFVGAFIFGIFANSQILLPLLYNLPRSTYFYFTDRLRFGGILWQFIAPASWLAGTVLFGFIVPSAAEFLAGNLGFGLGMSLSVIAVLLSLVTPSGLRDLKTDYHKSTFQRFGKQSRKQKQEREAYAAMLRARPASTWEKMPPMISIPDVRPRKSPSSPADKENLAG